MSSTEYLSVLTANQIIFSDFDDMSDQKIYIVYTKVAAPDNPHKYFDYTAIIEKRIKPRLTKLNQEGFQFAFKEQKNREI